MSGHINNGKGFLKEKMSDYRVDPPESVWRAVSARLSGRNTRRLIILTLAAAASIALAITLGVNYFRPELPGDGQLSVAEGPDQREEIREKTLEEKVLGTIGQIEKENSETATPSSPDIEERTPLNRELPGRESVRERVAVSGEIRETGIQTEVNVPVPDSQVAEQTQEEDAELDTGFAEAAKENVTDEVEATAQKEPSTDSGGELQNPEAYYPEETVSKDLKWNIGAAMSPLYSYRVAEGEAVAGTPDHESGLISYSGGIQVGYKVARRLALETGVFYNKMGIAIGAPGIQVNRNEFDFAPLGAEVWESNILAVSNSVGNIVSSSGDIYVNNYKLNASNDADQFNREFASEVYADEGIQQHLDYLEVPFQMRYALLDRSLKINLVWGLSANFLVNNYVTTRTAGETSEIGYLTNIRNVNYSGNAGIGLAYHFLNRFSFNLEPRFRYFMNSVNDDTLPSTRPYSFGLYTGLSYLF